MTSTSPYMVLHKDVEKANQIKATLMEVCDNEIICIHSAIDGIPAFETHQPHTVILSSDQSEMPLRVLVNAFRNLDPDVIIWICADMLTPAVDTLAGDLRADRLLALPLRPDAVAAPTPAPSLHQPTETLERTLAEIPLANPMLKGADPAEGFRFIDAKEINFAGRFRHKGNLKVVGDLKAVDELIVEGRLVVQGHVEDCHIKAERGITVEGRIIACKAPGIFTHGVLYAERAIDSVLVSGNNLYFDVELRDCLLNVVQKVCSRDHHGALIGGWARVGEYVDVGVLGAPEQNETEIHLAPPFLYQSWIAAKRRFMRLTRGLNPHFPADRVTLFEKHLADPDFYARLGSLRAGKVHPGISVKIGALEDYLFQGEHQALRLEVGRLPSGKAGVVRRRPKGASESTTHSEFLAPKHKNALS